MLNLVTIFTISPLCRVNHFGLLVNQKNTPSELLAVIPPCPQRLNRFQNAELSRKCLGAALHPIYKYQNPQRRHFLDRLDLPTAFEAPPQYSRREEKAAFLLFIDWINR